MHSSFVVLPYGGKPKCLSESTRILLLSAIEHAFTYFPSCFSRMHTGTTAYTNRQAARQCCCCCYTNERLETTTQIGFVPSFPIYICCYWSKESGNKRLEMHNNVLLYSRQMIKCISVFAQIYMVTSHNFYVAVLMSPECKHSLVFSLSEGCCCMMSVNSITVK